MSPSGKAPGSGPGIRGFESLHPSHENRQNICSGVFHNLYVGFRIPEWHEGVKIAGGNLQGNLPMQSMIAIVKFRGR